MSAYQIYPPAVIAFSGGRTSAFMLRQILDAHGDAFPDGVHVVFANTGKEREETLDFVRECGERWGVRIRWLEYVTPSPGAVAGLMSLDAVREAVVRADAAGGTEKQRGRRRRGAVREAIRAPQAALNFREVDYCTASRCGEPFSALIRRRNFLPNPVTRFCTQELKIRVMRNFALSLGWEEWTSVLGIRADEQHRLAKIWSHNQGVASYQHVLAPLAADGVTKAAVGAWWSAQPFDLRLKPWEGNCDLCFLKGWAKRVRIARDRPDLVDWWAEAEAEAVHQGVARHPRYSRFRKDAPSYARLKVYVESQALLPMPLDDAALDEPDALAMCAGCTD